MEIYNNFKEALLAIKSKYGANGLLDFNYFPDFAPNIQYYEKRLVKSVYE